MKKTLHSEFHFQAGVLEAGRAAAIAGVATAVPTLVAVRKIPYAKANISPTSQALIISTAAIAAFFITLDKALEECSKINSQSLKAAKSEQSLKAAKPD